MPPSPNSFPRPRAGTAPNVCPGPLQEEASPATRKKFLPPNFLKRPQNLSRRHPLASSADAVPAPPRTPHPSCQPSPGLGCSSSDSRAAGRGDGGEEGSEMGDAFKPHPSSSTCRCWGMFPAHPARQTSPHPDGPNHEQPQQILARAASRTTCPAR